MPALDPALWVIVPAAFAAWLAIPTDSPDFAAHRRPMTTTKTTARRGARHCRTGSNR